MKKNVSLKNFFILLVFPSRFAFVRKSRVEWALVKKGNPSRARVLKKKPCDALIPVCLSNDKRLAFTFYSLFEMASKCLIFANFQMQTSQSQDSQWNGA